MRPRALLAAALSAFLLASCEGEDAMATIAPEKIPEPASAAEIERLAGLRIFFGHQSVGRDLLEGIAEVAREKGARGPVVIEGRDAGAIPSPALLHAQIGVNGDPVGKIRDFAASLRGGIGDWADLALMKLCYADISAGTDIDAVFAVYKETMASVSRDFPRIAFLHMTVPLTAEEHGLGRFVKRLLGRERSSGDNAARERYNRLLREEYGGKGTLFDLALIESDGGEPHRALREEYTSDGGHLNPTGRRFAAERLLGFLASFAERRKVEAARS